MNEWGIYLDVALLREISAELTKARVSHPGFHSAHEGYAVLFEELDELWDEVRNDKERGAKRRMRSECIQIAAMAIRFIEDVCDDE